jgi:ABC-type antimicrobial peptide transport system permease subunit
MEKIFGESFFTYILFELKEDVDPHQWYDRIRNKLSNVEDQFRISFTKDKIKEYLDIYILLPIEGFLLSLIAIFFTFFYFQVIFRENEKQLLTSISRGMNPKLLQRTIFKCSVLLVMINILLSFIMGVIISVVIPFGPSFEEIKMFQISFLSFFVLLEFGGIILGILIMLIINHITLMKRINTSNLTTLRETILG